MEEKSDTITIKKDTLWKYSTFVLLGIIILGVIFFVLSDKSPTGNVIQQPSPNLPAQPSQVVTVEVGDAPVKGNSDSKIVLLEWSDYECPFCARFFSQSLSTVLNEDIQFVFKDYPLPFHSNAAGAANTARCAGEQGKYWEMHDLLFTQGVQGGAATFKQYAQQLGLTTTQFDSCLDSNKYESEIQADLQQGSTAGVQGTPGFILGTKSGDKVKGRLISGACPASTFQQAIAAEEAGKDWSVTNCQFAQI